MTLFVPAIVHHRAVRTARETFCFPLMMVFGLMRSILSVPITRATSFLLKSGEQVPLRWSYWLQMSCNFSGS